MMEDRKGILWYLVNGAVELSWFLGWAMFCSLTIMDRPFPFFQTIAAFALAAGLTHLATGRGWLMINVLGLEILGFIGAALLLIHGIYYDSYPLTDRGWLDLFLQGPRNVSEGLTLSLNLILIMVLWVLGVALARRPRGYASACNRFDLGLAAFFALFIIKLVALSKGAPITGDSLSLLFIFPFFLFGLLSVAMSRTGGAASKAFLSGYGAIGMIVSFMAAVLLATGGLLLFFLPGLTAAAQVGSRALAAAGRPLAPVVVAFLRFIFGPRNGPTIEAGTVSPRLGDLDRLVPQTSNWWMDLLNRILNWGLWGLLTLLLLTALVVIFFFAVRWLLSRTAGGDRQTKRSFPLWLAEWFEALKALGVRAWRKIMCGLRGYPKAAGLYGALLGWAGRSGVLHDCGETPLEFEARLDACFPAFRPQIRRIIGAYNREVYGETDLGDGPLAEVNSDWRFLRSPMRWPFRLKSRFSRFSSIKPIL